VSAVFQGEVCDAADVEFDIGDGITLSAPALDLDRLVAPRGTGFPALDVPLAEALDFIHATGAALSKDADGSLAAATEALAQVNGLGLQRMRGHIADTVALFSRDLAALEYERSLGGHGEGWRTFRRPDGTPYDVRWFPSRAVHVLAGNLPQAAALTIIRTVLTRGVALMKLPANDPFTAVAIVGAMRSVDPGHPLVRSLSAAYWRGGDAEVESVVFRPQFFEKVVAWGGEAAIRNVVRYLGPGLDLVTFDPKSSISVIGPGGLATPEDLARAARGTAHDVAYQEACSASRFVFVEGEEYDVDQYCQELLRAMSDYHAVAGGNNRPTPGNLVAEVDALRQLEPDYRVWGEYDGSGLVVRSDDPVDFYPDHRTVNVVRLDHVADVLRHVDIATQTVGVYPPALKAEWRDRLVGAGVDRVVDLGSDTTGGTGGLGLPHDGMMPLQRLVRWIYSHHC
jgi:Acyl-CoA reductase (LuxC)